MARADSLQSTESTGDRGLPRLAGLDGIRGLAALAVVFYHAGVAWLPAGFLGVDVFFVVSGFLITALLISERDQDGKNNLLQFWLRRARRLLPVLALVLIVTTVYAAFMLQDTLIDHLREVLVAAVYITNWDQIVRGVSYFEMFERPSQLRHLWSLAVEEQFYVIWPLLFAGLARLMRLRWVWCIVAGLAALSVVWMALLFTPGDEPSRVYFGSDARAFTILIGVAAAFVWKPWRRSWSAPLGALTDALALAALVGLGLIMVVGRHWSDWMYPWGLLATSFATIVLVAFVIRPGSLIGRALEAAPLRWMGERSYSIYLWHWPVLLALQWEFNFVPNTVLTVAVGLAATFILAELSYRFVERPMRRPDFWSLARMRGRLRELRPFLVATASLAAVVLLALVAGFALLPGRSLSDLVFTVGAEQSGYESERRDDAVELDQPVQPLPIRPTQDNRLTGTVGLGSDAAAGQTTPGGSDIPAHMRPIERDGNTEPPPGAALSDSANVTSLADGDHPTALLRQPPLVAYPPGDYYARYTIRAGDHLNGISRQFDTTIDELARLNGEEILRIIHPGDVLQVPCPGSAPCTFLRLEQQGQGCVSLQSPQSLDLQAQVLPVCTSGTMLVSLPLRLSAVPTHALSSLPRWEWNGSEIEGLDFTLLRDHTDPDLAAATVLKLVHGLPPLAIGDSVMAGAKSQLEEVGIEVNAEIGRQAYYGFAALKQDRERNGPRDTVIFQAIGQHFVDGRGFGKLLKAAEGVRHLIVLTRQFPPREPLLSYERDTNKMLREEAAKHDWVTLVDWNEITNGREAEVSWDGTHLNLLGRQLYADQILAAIVSRPPPLLALSDW
ncbi:MAG: acyltransferase family protein [Chloroflexi bacterium]|nr:acyltransferase family protein [Chloroflexota bacterium]MYD16672.1 acyltransferase family protein [Chloroflexota bacterium]